MKNLKTYLFLIRQQQRPIKFALSRLLMYSGLSKFFVLDRGTYKLRFYSSPVLAIVWMERDYGRDEERLFKTYLHPGDTVIDVGANAGILTCLAAAAVGPEGFVFAIEAHPRIFKYLQGNVRLNNFQQVHCIHSAAGDQVGTISFSDFWWDELNSVVRPGESGRTIPVKVATLDSIVGTDRAIDLLKVDVEGYEIFVFRGAEKVLERTKCIYFESDEGHFRNFGYSCSDLFRLLKSKGFSLYKLNGGTVFAPVEEGYVSKSTENIVATRDIDLLLHRTGFSLAR